MTLAGYYFDKGALFAGALLVTYLILSSTYVQRVKERRASLARKRLGGI